MATQHTARDPELEANLRTLKQLREQSPSTPVDARIAAIQDLLGEKEIFRTLHSLRWPEGVVCPRCGSSHIVRRDPPPESHDSRWFYECLNCKGQNKTSIFDDLTGLPIDQTITALKQWILCWYLLSFCSVTQIAKVLGITAELALQLASLGAQITSLPEQENVLTRSFLFQSHKSKSERFTKTQKEQTATDELLTRSESRGLFKPGPKSKY